MEPKLYRIRPRTMERERRTTTLRQLELLLEFAEANKYLALGRLRSKEARELSNRLWRECAVRLNSEGPARLPKEWAKAWNDLKCRVRSKLTGLTLPQRGTGGGPHVVSFTSLEGRVADVIGLDIGAIPNVAQDQFIKASPQEEQLLVLEFVDINPNESNEVKNEEHLPGSSCSLPYQEPPRRSQSPSPSPSSPRRTQSPSPSPQRTQSPSPSPRGTQSPSPSPQRTQAPSPSPSPPPRTQSSSMSSAPRRRRQRPRTRPAATRVHTQALTRRAALDEGRRMLARMEQLRAGTDRMLAQSALRQAEAAKAQAEAALVSAEANRLQAQTMNTFCEALCSLVPAVHLLRRNRSRRANVIRGRGLKLRKNKK